MGVKINCVKYEFLGGEDEGAGGERDALSPGSLFVGVRRATWLIMASMISEGMLEEDMVLTFTEFCLVGNREGV